ncbi:MAG: hypothetical protein ACXVIG_01815 [Halobacteriota archaeon]
MRYHDDIDAEPRRLRLKEGAPRSTFEQRLSTLDRKVAELSNIIHGVTQQLVEVSSAVNALERRASVDEHVADDSTAEPVAIPPVEPPRKKKKTAYLVADSEAPPEPRRRVENDIIIADRDS